MSERKQRRKAAVAAVVALVVVVLVVAAAWAAYAASADEPIAQDLSLESDLASATADTATVTSSDVETTSPMVEVPDIAGETLAEARLVLSALGLTVETVEEAGRETGKVGDERIVVSQEPAAKISGGCRHDSGPYDAEERQELGAGTRGGIRRLHRSGTSGEV